MEKDLEAATRKRRLKALGKELGFENPIEEALNEIFRRHNGGGIKLYDIKNGRTVPCQKVENLYSRVYEKINEADIYRVIRNVHAPLFDLWIRKEMLISCGVATEKNFKDINEMMSKLMRWEKKMECKYEQNIERISKKSRRSLVAPLVDLFDHNSKMSKDVALYSVAHILKHLDMESGSVEAIFKRIKVAYYRKREPEETDHI